MDLKDERNMILDMVSEGKITVEEAKQLLDALEQSARKSEREDDFIGPAFDIPMPQMPDISRIVNRATQRAYRRTMHMPRVFHNLEDLEDMRDELEDEVERLREQLEELKEQTRDLHAHGHKPGDDEDWDA